MKRKNPRLNGPLRNAANNGEIEKVRRLLEQGADPEAQAKNGQTALLFALWNGHLEVAELLLDAGANPFSRYPRWLSPIAMAAEKSDLSTLRLLLGTRHHRPEFGDLEHAMGWAVISASVDCLEELRQFGGDLRLKSPKDCRTLLDVARWWHHEAHASNKAKFQRVIDYLTPYF